MENTETTLASILARWDANEGKPYKGSLIDWSAYVAQPDNIGCMCAQGQTLYLLGGWSPERLRDTNQRQADTETARLLNISRAHAVLLRHVNDSIDGAPAIVLTDPGKVLGDQWSKLLDFWWHTDQMTAADWDAAGAAARDAARDAAGDAAGEIQGAAIFRAAKRPFYFLPMFGFADPDAIPERPANYGETA